MIEGSTLGSCGVFAATGAVLKPEGHSRTNQGKPGVPGGQLIVGGVVSVKVMVCKQPDIRPFTSITVQLRSNTHKLEQLP